MKKRNNELGDKIYKSRTAKNISQDDLAEKVGVSRQIISKWETGLVQPKADKLPLLCKALGIGVEVLMPPKETQQDIIVVNDNVEVASDVVHYNEAIEEQVEECDLQNNDTQEENSDKETTIKKRKLPKKVKIAILVTALLIVLSICIIVIASAITELSKIEGSLTEEVSTTWSKDLGDIGWTLLSVSIAIAVVLGIILVYKNARNKNGHQEVE